MGDLTVGCFDCNIKLLTLRYHISINDFFSSIELTLTISLFSFKPLLLNDELNILCTAKLVKTSLQESLGFAVLAAMKEQWFYTRYLLHYGKNSNKLSVLQ